jgi:hypothetical protein
VQDFEKLGAFYLGKCFDLDSARATDDLILYDSKDMVTHAVCVGMTGSGKTGLCIAILEEAAIDGIPAIVIDPKGDLANLLLTFPQFRPEEFAPWINEDDARRKGMSAPDFAKQQAELWKKGLADWGQDGARVQRLKDSAEFLVYTPGSNAGLPVSILKSFAAPGHEVRDDADLFGDRISTTATSLLGLLGIDADPIQSREHILLSKLFSDAWQEGKDLDLGALIAQIQQPPFDRIGVLDVESFYPSKERFSLAMRLNNLLAAPGFESWMKGEPLDVNQFLHAAGGKPRISIFSIAHLGDAERMFFVSLLLNQVLGWMRTQSGTTSLRAMLYMDEIFGFFPPISNPPSKAPLLTLLKQARAFGLGVMLATQNPVDLDYKGLSNAGTWFIGRLQTERDKARVLDGLEGAAAAANSGFDRDTMDQRISGLGNRVFLMNNVHDDGPEVFQTRWCMSYLRGPLTRNQIKVLMDPRRNAASAPPGKPLTPAAHAAIPPPGPPKPARPVLPPEVPQLFLPIRSPQPDAAQLSYVPVLLGTASVYFRDSKSGVDAQQDTCLLVPFGQGAVVVDFAHAEPIDLPVSELDRSPPQDGTFASPPGAAAQAKNYENWKKSLIEALYRNSKLELLRSSTLKQLSNPGENERDFRARLAQALREERDEVIEKLKQKYGPKLAAIQDRIRRAEQARQVQAEQARSAKLSTAISFGATVLGALFGRKKLTSGNVSRAGTAARGVGRSMKESQDVTRAQENIQALQQQYADLDGQFQAEIAAAGSKLDPTTEPLETIALRAKKSDITVKLVALGWAPHWQSGDESLPAWL